MNLPLSLVLHPLALSGGGALLLVGVPHRLPSHYVLLPEGCLLCGLLPGAPELLAVLRAATLRPSSLELQERWPGFSLPAGLPSGDLPRLESRLGIPPAKPRVQKHLQVLSNQMHLCACVCARACVCVCVCVCVIYGFISTLKKCVYIGQKQEIYTNKTSCV